MSDLPVPQETTAVPVALLRALRMVVAGAFCDCMWNGGSNVAPRRTYKCQRCSSRDALDALLAAAPREDRTP